MGTPKKKTVTTSISLPNDLFAQLVESVERDADPEMTVSKKIRALIRKDLATPFRSGLIK